MKEVVILGGGFAGVNAGLYLRKHLDRNHFKITIIDRNPYHTFTPSLYQVATSEMPEEHVALKYTDIFNNNGVNILTEKVVSIDTKKNKVILEKNKSMHFDFLLITLGSEPSYYGIEGLEKYSIPLKTIDEAVKIKQFILRGCKINHEDKLKIIIGGGGFSGTELAAEMLTYQEKLSRKFNLDPNCLDISILQGSGRLLQELDVHVSNIAQKRITSDYVHLCFGGHIHKVSSKKVYTDDGKSYDYDLLIWTGGVKASAVAENSNLEVDTKGRIVVDEFLQVKGTKNIFAAGDIVGFIDSKSQRAVPAVAQVAEDQGVVAAKNILRIVKGQELKAYKYHHLGYVVPLRGHYAVAEVMHDIHVSGFLGWVFEQGVVLYYFLKVFPLFSAIKKWNTFELAIGRKSYI